MEKGSNSFLFVNNESTLPDMHLLTGESVNKTCRICLKEVNFEQSYSIFAHITLEEVGESFSIPYVLFKITKEPLENNSLLPTRICSRCVELLKDAFLFKITYEKSVAILRHRISNFVAWVGKQTQNIVRKDIIIKTDTQVNSIQPETCTEIKFEKDNAHINSEVQFVDWMDNFVFDEAENSIKSPTNKQRIPEKTLHPCPICQKTFTALKLKIHARTNHPDIKRYVNKVPKVKKRTWFYTDTSKYISRFSVTPLCHKCPYCEAKLIASEFVIHLLSHNNREEHICDLCKRVFGNSRALNVHKSQHRKEHPYKCEYCSKSFALKMNLDYHLNTHLKTEGPYQCKYCSKTFHNPVYLKRHLTKHTDEVPYNIKLAMAKRISCRACTRYFHSHDELQRHVCTPAVVKRNSVKKKYRFAKKNVAKKNVARKPSSFYKKLCSQCGKHVVNLKEHMVRHTGEKPYMCNICGKRYATSQVYKAHLQCHSETLPYMCSVCGKAFRIKNSFLLHKKIHEGTKSHVCPVCQKAFLMHCYMMKHFKSCHSNSEIV